MTTKPKVRARRTQGGDLDALLVAMQDEGLSICQILPFATRMGCDTFTRGDESQTGVEVTTEFWVTYLEAAAPDAPADDRLSIKAALDACGVQTGNEHETYTLARRIVLLAQQRDYFLGQTDKLRAELEKAK